MELTGSNLTKAAVCLAGPSSRMLSMAEATVVVTAEAMMEEAMAEAMEEAMAEAMAEATGDLRRSSASLAGIARRVANVI